VADERVLKEVALFADRCDVTEELTRLGSHLEQLETLLRSDGEIGRKAEFILQEIGREVHTIGSKANDLSISREILRRHGNMSSPSVLFALAEALREDRPRPSEDWWLTSFGAGFSAHACRLSAA
jgi:predicted naringenin-chalcone synthase